MSVASKSSHPEAVGNAAENSSSNASTPSTSSRRDHRRRLFVVNTPGSWTMPSASSFTPSGRLDVHRHDLPVLPLHRRRLDGVLLSPPASRKARTAARLSCTPLRRARRHLRHRPRAGMTLSFFLFHRAQRAHPRSAPADRRLLPRRGADLRPLFGRRGSSLRPRSLLAATGRS